MDISRLLILDPKTKEPSVSLTMLLASFLVVLVASGLDMAGKVKGTSVILEVFWGNCALYFGRRVSLKSGNNVESKDTSDKGI